MPTPTLNLLAEVLVAESDLDKAQSVIERVRKTPIGKLPFVRSTLNSRKINIDAQRIRIEAAKQYLTSTE
jgi:hypothetical protein